MGIPSRVPAVLFNIEHGLFLRFMINPFEITRSKGNSYEALSPTGWEEPIQTWTKGNARKITFEMFYDSTSSFNNVNKVKLPGLGVLDIIAILEAFQYPGVPVQYRSLKQYFTQLRLAGKATTLSAPPRATLLMGARYWTGVLDPFTLTETAFDSKLVPQRVTANLSITVDSDGVFLLNEDNDRFLLSTIGSARQVAELALETSSTLVNVLGGL